MYTKLFHSYINSWLEKDCTAFLSTLSNDIEITECYGASYHGKDECENWFKDWTTPSENQVIDWEIQSTFFDANKKTAFFLWRFHCEYKSKTSIFDGISLVKFDGNKICEIQEFEQSAEKYYPYFKKN